MFASIHDAGDTNTLTQVHKTRLHILVEELSPSKYIYLASLLLLNRFVQGCEH